MPSTTEPLSCNVIGRPYHPHAVFLELVIPSTIIDRTPEFECNGPYWNLNAEAIPMTVDGFWQVCVSMSARMDLICAQEKESRALLAAAQFNVANAL